MWNSIFAVILTKAEVKSDSFFVILTEAEVKSDSFFVILTEAEGSYTPIRLWCTNARSFTIVQDDRLGFLLPPWTEQSVVEDKSDSFFVILSVVEDKSDSFFVILSVVEGS